MKRPRRCSAPAVSGLHAEWTFTDANSALALTSPTSAAQGSTVNFSATTSYTPTTFLMNSGFEQIYVNGSQFNEIDYNLADNLLDGFPSAVTGTIDIIQFSANNLGIPCSNITNTVAYSLAGATTYTFA